jgi:hypothetical protein
VKYSGNLPVLVSANPDHSQGNNPYILEGTEAFTLLVTFLLHYDKIFPELKNFHYTGIFIRNSFVTFSSLLEFL